jgi:hypothetical protein
MQKLAVRNPKLTGFVWLCAFTAFMSAMYWSRFTESGVGFKMWVRTLF